MRVTPENADDLACRAGISAIMAKSWPESKGELLRLGAEGRRGVAPGPRARRPCAQYSGSSASRLDVPKESSNESLNMVDPASTSRPSANTYSGRTGLRTGSAPPRDHPASQKVLDPACGYRQFSVPRRPRRQTFAAGASGRRSRIRTGRVGAETVFGLDVPPRRRAGGPGSPNLLALGPDLLAQRSNRRRHPGLSGDALLWSVRGGDLFGDTLEIQVPPDGGHGERCCRVPGFRLPGPRAVRRTSCGSCWRTATPAAQGPSGHWRGGRRRRRSAVLGDAYATLGPGCRRRGATIRGLRPRNLSRPLAVADGRLRRGCRQPALAVACDTWKVASSSGCATR